MRAVTTAPIRGPAAWRRTLEVKERYLAAGDPDRLPAATSGVRPEILSSWRRCLLSGVDAGATDLPRDEDAPAPERLVRAARPVAERLADQLAGMRVWAFLADRECRLIWSIAGTPDLVPLLEARGAFPGARFAEDAVGTNGLGTAVEERRPFMVAGSEHFRGHESHATTAGAPVRDPLTGRLAGLLNVNCRYDATNRLLLPLVVELARSIEVSLRGTSSMSEQALLDEFLRVSRRGSRAVVALGPDLLIANAPARTLLRGADIEPLRTWVIDSGDQRTELRLGEELVVAVARTRPLGPRGAVLVLGPAGADARSTHPLADPVSDVVTGDDAPADLRHLTKLERLERQALVAALRDAGWDCEAAARDLGISRATIYRRLRRYGIRAPAR